MTATIRTVEAFNVPYTEPNDHDSTRWVCLVRVMTDDGVVGWGEAAAIFEEAARATTELVRAVAPVLLGSAVDAKEVASALRERGWWYGDTGIACFARAAVDLALWDVAGRTAGRSLLDLLGGSAHSSLPVLLSTHATSADLGTMADQLAGQVHAVGALGVKVGFGKAGDARLGYEHDRDVEFVRILRSALGPGPSIMVDIGARLHWSLEEALARIHAFEAYDLAWIEEPLGADDPPGYRTLKESVSTAIAYGEREWTPRGIERIVATGTVDIVGIDPGRVEGVSGFRSAAAAVEAGGAQLNAHAFTGPLVYAASLALSLSSAAARQLEVTPYRNNLYDLVDAVAAPEAGRVVGADRPGLGVEVDEVAVRVRAV